MKEKFKIFSLAIFIVFSFSGNSYSLDDRCASIMKKIIPHPEKFTFDELDYYDYYQPSVKLEKTWNYENAPKEVIDKAHKLAVVCKSHCVPMPAAALRFPLAHPAVKSVIPGCRNPQEFKQLMEWWNTKIPTELWSDLKSQGLIDQIAPVPGA